jgi:hypothetical protein
MLTTSVKNDQLDHQAGSDLTDQDRAILARVDGSLADGLSLLRWWRQTQAANSYAQRFELVRTFNRPDVSFAFFDRAPIATGTIPVMGIVEDMLYDQAKQAPVEKVRDELREFVLHYFMRISAFERPEAYAEAGNTAGPRFLPTLSWCPTYEANKSGFGFSQLYYKRRDTGQIGKFRTDQQSRIVDLRQIGTTYEWIVTKVRIYDFNLTIRPRGQESLQFILPLKEESYLVLSPDFLVHEDNPSPQVLGRYGFGYAFIKDPFSSGPIAYGPGQFSASFQLIHFRVLNTGRIQLDLIFVANRPEKILNIPLAPVDWSLQLADLLSLGLASPFLVPVRALADRWPVRLGSFDPVSGFVSLANALTGGVAAQDYCISREQLERQFLVQHFMQHYQMATSSLLTWRQVPDWLDRAALPAEIIDGVST